MDNRPREWWPSITKFIFLEIECSGFYRFIIAYEIIEKQRKVTGPDWALAWWIKLPNSLFFIFIFCREGINLRFKKYKSTKDKKKNTNIQKGSSVSTSSILLVHPCCVSLLPHSHNLKWLTCHGHPLWALSVCLNW